MIMDDLEMQIISGFRNNVVAKEMNPLMSSSTCHPVRKSTSLLNAVH